MKVSLIIPTFNRLEHLKRLWTGLAECSTVGISLEILFIINGEDEKTKDYLKGLEGVTVLQCDKTTAALARHLGIDRAQGEWVLFLDDDVQLSKYYFQKALKILAQWGPDVLGGPDGPPLDGTAFQRAYAFCQSCFLVTGHTNRRHHPHGTLREASESQLILCHLWIKMAIFQEGFRFPHDYPRNEENILLYQLKRAGKKIVYDPQLSVYHFKKTTISQVVKATLVSGQCRMRSFFDYPHSFHLLFLVPALFVLYLLSLPLLFFLGPEGWWPYGIAPLKFYGILYSLTMVKGLAQGHPFKVILWAMLLILPIHLSYGWGILRGGLGRKALG